MLGEAIDKLYDLKQKKKEFEEQARHIAEQISELEQSIIDQLDTAGIDLARGNKARVSITEASVPVVEDWGAVHQYILEQEALYLFERRLAVGPWRELYQSGDLIPGTKAFTRRRINSAKV